LTNKLVALLHCVFDLSLKMAFEQTDMTEVIDLSALPPNVPSLCIPRVFKNITKERVFNCFKDLGIGFVERIDMVPRKADNGDEFQRVFVHLRWNKSEQASKARSRVLSGKEIKIIYDEPWFWKVSANRSVSRDSSARDPRDSRPGDRPRATLALEDDDLEGSIRKIKAQNDRDRKGGYKPRQYNSSQRGGAKQHQHRPQQPKQQLRPRSPSSSPPPPIASAEASIMASAAALALAAVAVAARSPSPDLLDDPSVEVQRVASPSPDHLDCPSPFESYDVDAPSSNSSACGQAIDYGECFKLPAPKKRVIKKPVLKVEKKEEENAGV
jgi:hypothetical protein